MMVPGLSPSGAAAQPEPDARVPADPAPLFEVGAAVVVGGGAVVGGTGSGASGVLFAALGEPTADMVMKSRDQYDEKYRSGPLFIVGNRIEPLAGEAAALLGVGA